MSIAQLAVESADMGPADRLLLEEWESRRVPELADSDIGFIQEVINKQGTERLGLSFDRQGDPALHTKQYVGALTCPSGLHLDILPKAGRVDLLGFLRYAHGREADFIDTETALQEGKEFLDILGHLFLGALRTVLVQGLSARYKERQESTRRLRGRWNLTREIQQQRHHLPSFESDYQEHTHDHLLNQALLHATYLLMPLVADPGLRDGLGQYRALLEKLVHHRPVRAHEVQDVHLTRLNRHYEPALNFARLILKDLYLGDLRRGVRPSYAILVDMNHVFEKALERAAQETQGSRPGWSVAGQASTTNLVEGTPKIRLRPDLLVRHHDKPVLVADAKWKVRSKPANSDVYQLVSYMLAHECDGMLLYPAQGGNLRTSYRVKGGRELTVEEVPVRDVETMRSSVGQLMVRED